MTDEAKPKIIIRPKNFEFKKDATIVNRTGGPFPLVGRDFKPIEAAMFIDACVDPKSDRKAAWERKKKRK